LFIHLFKSEHEGPHAANVHKTQIKYAVNEDKERKLKIWCMKMNI